MENNILLLGSNGFFGKNIKRVLEKKEFDYYAATKEDFDIRDIQSFNKFLSSNKNFSCIINSAAFVGGISYGEKYPDRLLFENLEIMMGLYRTAKKFNIPKIINPISNCSYPGHLSNYDEKYFWDGKIHESVEGYGFAKKSFIVASKIFKKNFNINTINLILPNMFGEFDYFDEYRSHALGALIRKIYYAKINNINSVEIWGTGNPMREWLYVKDAADILVQCISQNISNDYINIGSGSVLSIKSLAEKIAKIIDFKGKFIFNSSKPDGAMIKKMIINPSSPFSDFEYSPFDFSLNKTIEYYIKSHEKSSI